MGELVELVLSFVAEEFGARWPWVVVGGAAVLAVLSAVVLFVAFGR